MANVLQIVIKGRDAGAIAVINRVGLAARAQRQQLEGLQTIQGGLQSSGMKAMGAGVALGGGLLWAAKQGAEFEQELRNVNTMAKLDAAGFRALTSDVLELARNPLIVDSPAKLAAGLYEVQSAGFKGQAGLEVLRVSAIGAAAGVEDTAAASNTLVAIMNAYNQKTGPDAVRIMDQLFASVEIGVFRFRDMVGEIGPVAAVAGQLQLPFEQVTAAIALLTNKGFAYSEAATAVERSMTSFLTPSKALTRAAQEAGYETALQAIQTEGLAGAMKLLEKATAGDQAALAAIFPNIRALRGAMALGGESAADYARMVAYVKDSTGAAGRAAEEVARGPMFEFRKVLQGIQTEATKLSQETLLPIGKDLLNDVRRAIMTFRQLPPEQQRSYINMALMATKTLLAVGALAMLSGGLLNIIQLGAQVRGGLGAIFGGLRAIGGLRGLLQVTGVALRALPALAMAGGKALIAFLASPAGWVTLALAALAVELGFLFKLWKEMRAAQQQEKQAKLQEIQASAGAKQRGTLSWRQAGRDLGYNEKQLDRIENTGAGNQDFDRISQRVTEYNRSQTARKSAENRNRIGAADAAGRAAAQQQAAYQPEAGAYQSGASTRRGQYVNVLNIKMTFSDARQMKAFVNGQLDEQFGMAAG